MDDLIYRSAALACFPDWMDKNGHEHSADEDVVYQKIADLPSVREKILADCFAHWDELTEIPDIDGDLISRQAAIDALEKCYTCKHVYQRVSDADTLYCRCRKGCRYEEFKPKRSTGNPQWHEGGN